LILQEGITYAARAARSLQAEIFIHA